MSDKRITGEYVQSSINSPRPYKAFIPFPLPPEPPISMDSELCDLMDRANRALGRLDGVTVLLPDEYLFTYFYVRKEAVLSSQIEGTQSTLSQLLLFEIEEVPGVPIDDAKEVLNYVRAMQWGLSSIASSKRLPLSLRLIKEIHSLLLDGNRGGDKDPGEFRRYQNWVGGSNPSEASFVGPPPDRVAECMNEFEKFLHDLPEKTPVLMKAALAHVQFETIHPFGDGNGRLGRLLITLLLCAEGALRQPMLYLSLFFKTNREQYYEKLQQVRNDGDWEGWLRFFLQGVEETAQQAVGAAQAILKLFAQDRDRIVTLKQQATAALRIHEILQKRPILSIKRVAERLSLSIPTATKGMQNLERLGIVREITEKDRYRLYMYQPYVDILNEGTTPLR